MKSILFLCCTLICLSVFAQDPLYRMSSDQARWATFENPKAAPGMGGLENKSAKGHAYDPIKAGEVKTLLNVTGMGIVQRIWLTFNDRSPAMLRALRIDMYWDGASQPAVSAPIGDFFSISHGQIMPFENALFSSPEGRSFNCRIPMPFRKGARITVTNESDHDLNSFYYDVDFQRTTALPADALYFHCHWRREHKTQLTVDFNMLPEVKGKGRFLGVNVGLISAPEYGKSWWGEGEVKIYVDSDGQVPTIVGTGAEDYIGSGWGLGKFIQWHQGCPVANDSTRQWSFYRFHIPDPIYFQQKLRATIQVLGGDSRDQVRRMLKEGTALIPVSVSYDQGFMKLFEGNPPALDAPNFPNGWVNFYRQEDYCATAYFYLDKPMSGLPALPAVADRIKGL